MSAIISDPKAIVREVVLARLDNRRGFKAGDSVPGRQFWPSLSAVLSAMADNPVAFRAYEYADGTAGLSIMAEYVVISRAKKSAPWIDTKERLLATCAYDAETQLPATPTRKAVDVDAWISMQTKQHLRAVGIS